MHSLETTLQWVFAIALDLTFILLIDLFFPCRYPSAFIEKQFQQFFASYLQLSPFVFYPKDSTEFYNIRTQLLDRPTHRQSQVAQSVVDGHAKNDTAAAQPMPASTTNTKTSDNEAKHGDRLIVHYTHEKRLASMKRDLHQTYDHLFKNTPAQEARLIVGTRNRRDARNELIRKRPKRSLLRNCVRQSSSSDHFFLDNHTSFIPPSFFFLF